MIPLARMVLYHVPFKPDEPWLGQLFTWTYLYNFPFAFGLFGTALPNISHFWSLAVEEQFYLIWPSIVAFVSSRTLKIICVVVIATSPFVRAGLLLRGFPWAAYILTTGLR